MSDEVTQSITAWNANREAIERARYLDTMERYERMTTPGPWLDNDDLDERLCANCRNSRLPGVDDYTDSRVCLCELYDVFVRADEANRPCWVWKFHRRHLKHVGMDVFDDMSDQPNMTA